MVGSRRLTDDRPSHVVRDCLLASYEYRDEAFHSGTNDSVECVPPLLFLESPLGLRNPNVQS